jgi:hypothetical protein
LIDFIFLQNHSIKEIATRLQRYYVCRNGFWCDESWLLSIFFNSSQRIILLDIFSLFCLWWIYRKAMSSFGRSTSNQLQTSNESVQWSIFLTQIFSCRQLYVSFVFMIHLTFIWDLRVFCTSKLPNIDSVKKFNSTLLYMETERRE